MFGSMIHDTLLSPTNGDLSDKSETALKKTHINPESPDTSTA